MRGPRRRGLRRACPDDALAWLSMVQTTDPAANAPANPPPLPRDARRIAASVSSKFVWLLVGAVVFSPIATAARIYIDNRGWFDFLGASSNGRRASRRDSTGGGG